MNRKTKREILKFYGRKNTKGQFRFNPTGLTSTQLDELKAQRIGKLEFKRQKKVLQQRLVVTA